ncbi:MAG: hypothetical protein U9R25_11560 [Chloroflexota bacterium]|nr:hypothetical protein [Chloroflexota bacterium]
MERFYVGIVRNLGMPVAERVRHMPVRRHLLDLERSQWWSPQQLRALQEQKLQRLVSHAYEGVPLFRNLWDAHGVQPADIRTLEDVQRLPLLHKQQLRDGFPEETIAADTDRADLVLYSSSGSTGTPFRYVMTRAEKGQRWANLYRCWAWAGLEPGIRFANVMHDHAIGAFQGGWLQGVEQRLMNMVHILSFGIHDERLDDAIETLVEFQPRIIRTFPATIHRLAEAFEQRGIKMPLRSILTSGEVLWPFQRETAERVFQCQVFDTYGGDGMDVAFQCGHCDAYHINVESVILEVVDDQGHPLAPGEEGQIVLTNLNNLAMPFVRYAIEDVGALRGESCPCGRGLPLLDHVTGRSSDQLWLPSGRALLIWFFVALFRKTPGIDAFQVRQTAPEHILFTLVPGEDFGHLPASPDQTRGDSLIDLGEYVGPETVVDYLRQRIDDEQIKGEAAFDIQLVDRIPSGPGGKRRFFIADNID